MKNSRETQENGELSFPFHNEDITFVLNGKVTVDMVRNVINPENPHADLIANTIVGRLFTTKDMAGLGMILTATLGISKEVNIEVGRTYNTAHTYYDSKRGEYLSIGSCLVLNTNPFANPSENVEIEYYVTDSQGGTTAKRTYISAKELELI